MTPSTVTAGRSLGSMGRLGRLGRVAAMVGALMLLLASFAQAAAPGTVVVLPDHGHRRPGDVRLSP